MATPEQLYAQLRQIEDPELGFSIVDLGLIYGITVDRSGVAVVTMTLTSQACPVGEVIKQRVINALLPLPGLRAVKVVVTFDPPWSPEKASADLKQHFALLGIPLTRF